MCLLIGEVDHMVLLVTTLKGSAGNHKMVGDDRCPHPGDGSSTTTTTIQPGKGLQPNTSSSLKCNKKE